MGVNEKAINCIFPAIWHSGKCETMETGKKKQWFREVELKEDEKVAYTGFLRQWEHSEYHDDGYTSLYIFLNLCNIQHQKWP